MSELATTWSGAGWELRAGDCLRLLMDMPDNSVDAVVTDPPYSSGGAMRSDRQMGTGQKYSSAKGEYEWGDFAGDSRSQHAFGFWVSLWMSELLRVCKPGGIAMVFTDWRQLSVVMNSIEAGGWVVRGVIPWIKPAARPQRGRFSHVAEYAVWATNGPRALGGHCAKGLSTEGPDSMPSHLESPAPRNRIHLTPKPLKLMRELMKLTPEGGTVLDMFAGSGTTAVAAMREGRKAILFEIMAENCPLIAERLEAEERGLTLADARAGRESLL